MGVFSKVHRYREGGEDVNVFNAETYGRPVNSLFTSTKVFSLHHHIDITDASGNVVYQAQSKMISLHDKTDIYRADGEFVAHIERKFFTLHERHFVTMRDGMRFELSNEIMHIIKDITNIVGLGWQLRGNLLGLNFELLDEEGNVIAVIGQKMFSIHDKYCIDIYQEEHEETVVAILVALQHMMRDRAAAASGGSGGGSSSGG
ncbi:MAG: LURP-one-related family protein [Lachnospiraceae bacterium]|nr:LURP-one-related family protein [Lachnospiraceae bacterium]